MNETASAPVKASTLAVAPAARVASKARRSTVAPAIAAAAFLACSSSGQPSPQGAGLPGGPPAIGGAAGAGGATGSMLPDGTGGASGARTTAGSSGGAVPASGGAPAPGGGGTSASGGTTAGSGGMTSTPSSGGAAAAGAPSMGGTTGTGGQSSAGGAPACGGPLAATPFGCKLAWGTNEPKQALSELGYLDFVSKWVGYEVAKDGSFSSCDGCTWLGTMKGTNLVPVYYAYFIGFLGHANGLPDGNQNPNGPNLTTDAANLIRQNRSRIVSMYGEYARKSHDAWATRPLVWLLEGDYVQYTASSQKNALTLPELADLARDTACAIKSNMPNAVVAINHSTWNPDATTNDFWNAMKSVAYDLVWTTGVAGNDGYFDAMENGSSYNHATATYAYVSKLTGRKILVDTSFGLSMMGDSWSTASASVLNARIADGVIAINVSSPAGSYMSSLATLRPMLGSVCH